MKHIFYTTNKYLLNDSSLESLWQMEPKNKITLLKNLNGGLAVGISQNKKKNSILKWNWGQPFHFMWLLLRKEMFPKL